MNVEAVNQAGLKPLQPLLDRIDALKSKDELPELMAYLDSIGVNTLFAFGSDQDFKDATQQIAVFDQLELGLPEKGYYERTDEKSVKLRDQYQAHVARTFQLLGESPAQAAKDAQTVMKLETAACRLFPQQCGAAGSCQPVPQDGAGEIGQQHAVVQLRSISARRASPAVESLNITSPAYFAGLNNLLASNSLDTWKTYLRWTLIRHLPKTALPEALDRESFDFYGKVLEGQPEQKPRWKRCVAATDDALGEALGQVYVEQRFSPKDKARTLELTHDIEAAMGKDIEQLPWMSAVTKARAEEKLHAVADKIGYPDKWRDYSTLTVTRGDALGNAMQASAFEERREIAKIGKPVDRGEWGMSPPTVNAYYNAQMNDINFPAGILQPPFFDRQPG